MHDTQLLKTLKARFERHMQRHRDIAWLDVQTRLESAPQALESLRAMEDSGGEPDVMGRDETTQGASSFVIARQKALPVAAAFATTEQPWTRARSTSRSPVRLNGQPRWALRC